MYKYISLGVIAYLVFAVYYFPASFAYSQAQSFTDNKLPVKLNGVNGSIWSGSANSVTVGQSNLNDVKWHFKPFSLILGKLELGWEFVVEDGYGKGVAGRSLLGATYLHNVEAWLPALDIMSMANLAHLRLGGSLAINLEEFELGSEKINAILGSITWHEAEIAILQPVKLGGLEVIFEPTEEGIVGNIADKGGPLQANGKLVLTDDGKYTLDGEVSVRDPSEAALKSSLNMLGRPDKSGKIKLKRSGDLSQLGLF